MANLTRQSSLAWNSGSLQAFRVRNLNHNPNVVESLSDDNYVGAPQSDHNSPGAKYAQVSFTSDLRGFTHASPADVLAPEMALLKACGFKAANVGSPVTGYTYSLDDPHLTTEDSGILTPIGLVKNVGNKAWSAGNCVGDVTFNFEPGQKPSMDFSFFGDYSANVAETSGSTYYTGRKPYACYNYSATITSGTTVYSDLSIMSLTYAVNNNIPHLYSLNATTGVDQHIITSRNPIATMVVRLPYDLSDFNPEDLYDSQSELTIEFTHNTAGSAGDVIDVEFDAYIDEFPEPSEADGCLIYTLVLRQSVDSGAIPFTLTWS